MGPAIAVVIHSVDPSLISRLILWSAGICTFRILSTCRSYGSKELVLYSGGYRGGTVIGGVWTESGQEDSYRTP